jgi:hypothetical protein
VGVAFGAGWEGEPRVLEGADAGTWFSVLPADMHDEQAAFLKDDPAAEAAFRAGIRGFG